MHISVRTILTTLFISASYGTPASCLAQQYELQYIGHYSKAGETLIKATKSGFVLGEVGGCPFLYNENKKSLTYLCKKGLQKAYDVNELGVVVGYTTQSDIKMPAYWTSAKGTKRISLFSGYVGGEALSINDHLEIAGYQYKVSSLPGYYYDQNSNSTCDEETEGPCYKDTKLAKGFKYSKKIGLKSAFNQADTGLSVAFKINNSGTILGYISKPDFTNSNGEFAIAAQKVNKDLSFSGRPQTTKPAVWYAINMAELTAGSFNKVDLNDKNIGASGDTLYNFSSRKTSTKTFGNRFLGDRGDYSTDAGISNQGTVSSYKNGFPLLWTAARDAVALKCLIPANTPIAPKSRFTAKDLSYEEAGLLQGENIIFLADVVGDDKEKLVFKLIKLPKDKFGTYYSFCPTISLSLRCKNQQTNQWTTLLKTRYDHDNGNTADSLVGSSNNETYRDNFLGSTGYAANIPAKEGQSCELNSRITSGLIPVPGATFTFATQDAEGELGEPCTTKVKTTVRSSLIGSITPIAFNARNEFNRFLMVKPQNPKLYSYTEPTYFKFIVGDETAPVNSTCE